MSRAPCAAPRRPALPGAVGGFENIEYEIAAAPAVTGHVVNQHVRELRVRGLVGRFEITRIPLPFRPLRILRQYQPCLSETPNNRFWPNPRLSLRSRSGRTYEQPALIFDRWHINNCCCRMDLKVGALKRQAFAVTAFVQHVAAGGLQSQGQARESNGEALKMSYLTSPADVNLIPTRLVSTSVAIFR
jgi:hypothetical protein